ncbi:MAG: ABC transporter ATP-binding protein [Thermodesulfobacteriota bacterium]
MSNPVISVRGLSKKYRIGIQRHDTLRDQIASAFKSLLRRNTNPHAASPKPQAPSSIPHAPSSMPHANHEEFWALRDVSFDVQQGEVIGIIGRNGAGKSTLLKILSQITEPTTGEINIKGRVASLLEVGTGFHPELTGRENIFLNGAILGMSRAEIKRKFDEIVAFSEIEKFIDTPVKHYSSGMYVRLAFAVAAHLEPEILIVDEVLAVGDAEFQKKCLGKMQDVSKSGRTILFVSHNMDAILNLCSSTYVIESGKATEALSPQEGVHHYLNYNSNCPLIERSRFQSTHRSPMIRDIRVHDDLGRQNVVFMGKGVNFDILLYDFKDIFNVQCALAITNQFNQRVVQFHSRYHSDLLIPSTDYTKLSCYVPSLPLAPGTYYVDILLGNENLLYEKVERAAQFEVVFNDFLGYGRIPPKAPGNIILHCEWQLA